MFDWQSRFSRKWSIADGGDQGLTVINPIWDAPVAHLTPSSALRQTKFLGQSAYHSILDWTPLNSTLLEAKENLSTSELYMFCVIKGPKYRFIKGGIGMYCTTKQTRRKSSMMPNGISLFRWIVFWVSSTCMYLLPGPGNPKANKIPLPPLHTRYMPRNVILSRVKNQPIASRWILTSVINTTQHELPC